jgi:hypothetical protein
MQVRRVGQAEGALRRLGGQASERECRVSLTKENVSPLSRIFNLHFVVIAPSHFGTQTPRYRQGTPWPEGSKQTVSV